VYGIRVDPDRMRTLIDEWHARYPTDTQRARLECEREMWLAAAMRASVTEAIIATDRIAVAIQFLAAKDR
jgi:hypothetical protein